MNEDLPWTDADLYDFEVLVNPFKAPGVVQPPQPAVTLRALASNPLIGLMAPKTLLGEALEEPIRRLIGDPAKLGTTVEGRYERYMARVRANPYYQWLERDPGFRDAYRLFVKRRRDKREPNPYRAEWAELRFLHITAGLGIHTLLRQLKHQPPVPSSRDRRKALTRAESLKESLERGVRLASVADHQNFSRLLEVFVTELSGDNYQRPRVDSNLFGRQCVAFLTKRLMAAFSMASPTIIANLVAITGYSPDRTAIDRHIKRAKTEWQRDLDKSTRTHALKGLPALKPR